MGKKKKKRSPEVLYWCYYCDRVFKDEGTLILHQKAKHFRCLACTKKLNTAQGLQVHCDQVHKINVERVPAAKPGRDSMDREIFGMAGVPEGMRPGGVFDEPAAKRAAVEGGENPPPPPMQPPLPGESAEVPRQPTPMMSAYASGPPVPMPMYAPHAQPLPPPMGVHPGIQPQGVQSVYPPQPYGMNYGYVARPPGPVRPVLPPRPMLGAPLPGIQGVPPPAPPGTILPPGATPPMSRPLGQPLRPPGVIQAPPARAPGLPPGLAAAQSPGPAMPRGGALFPIVPSPAPAPRQMAPPALAAEGDGGQGVAVGVGAGDLDLVWKDEENSMEEERAKLPKYAAYLQNGSRSSEAPPQGSFAGFQ